MVGGPPVKPSARNWGSHVYRATRRNPADRHSRNQRLLGQGYHYRCRHCGLLLRDSRDAIGHLRDTHGLPYKLHPTPAPRPRRRRR
jgi:uncharacterized C2H2 Zn-finger protein